MRSTRPLAAVPLGRLSRVRELLDVLAAIRQLAQPLTTPEGLRQAITQLLRLAELLGLDPRWLDRLAAILDDEDVLKLVAAIMQYILGHGGREQLDDSIRVRCVDGEEIVIDQQSFLDWLPLVIQLLNLWRSLRGELPAAAAT